MYVFSVISTQPSTLFARPLGYEPAERLRDLRLPFAGGVVLAIKRFDRTEGRRLHTLSANVALKAAGVKLSYPNLPQLQRRRGDVETHRAQMPGLFRRMVFNILIDNTDATARC